MLGARLRSPGHGIKSDGATHNRCPMDLEQIFSLSSMAAMLGWLFLVLLPFWRGSQWIAGALLPLLLAVAYAVLIAGIFKPGDMGNFSTLAGVKELMSNDQALLVGWLHYLAFDLFIGAWEVRDARKVGVHHLLVIPCLFFTFMFGPVGLLLYFIIRTLRARGMPSLT